ncbi:UNVERIFIED_CONTAM: hypothetical protein Slati_2435600 [Sesamum latifolium]|uniref:DUF4283 domain-containing protein n=1 Tax=Sesamum latifolium TaxID=2727402 RepID=A0AAW2WHS5_9LAMI
MLSPRPARDWILPRVCVMMDFNATLPKHIVMIFPGEDGNEQPYIVDVEYEWIPSKCLTCRSLGRTTAGCPSTKKPAKPPVAVYVQKPPSRIPKEPSAVDDPANAKHAAGGVDSHNNSPRFSPTAHKGNRIWLAWDETEVEVDILIVHYQCIHCRVFVKRAHLSSLVTVVYGHNEVVPRRELWKQLSSILDNMGDDPWLVMGDFNGS